MPNLSQDTLFPFDNFLSSFDSNEGSDNDFIFDRFLLSMSNNEPNKINGHVRQNKYSFKLCRNRFSDKKSTIIICSKDNKQITKFCLEKIKSFQIQADHDIFLVDDRSCNDDILHLSDEYETSYLRIDNTENVFNYSVINNIAASYASKYNKELLIFYNNDLWPSTSKTLPSIIEKHFKFGSNITGCRLVYPSKQDYKDIGNHKHLLDKIIDSIYNTIQHGGIFFAPKMSAFTDNNRIYGSPDIVLAPSHLWRFYEKETKLACSDSSCYAVTGALHIISVKDFVELGGLNMGMGIAFQDIDLCIKAIEKSMTVNYIGSEYMYHAESITNALEQVTKTKDFSSDHVLWDLLWGVKLPYLLGYLYINKL